MCLIETFLDLLVIARKKLSRLGRWPLSREAPFAAGTMHCPGWSTDYSRLETHFDKFRRGSRRGIGRIRWQRAMRLRLGLTRGCLAFPVSKNPDFF